MSIFVSEPARPGPQRLPETLRKRRVNEADDMASSHSAGPHNEPGLEQDRSPDRRMAERAAAGYQREAAEELSPELPYLPVSQLVNQGVIAVDSGTSLADARAVMAQHVIHHLVVLHDGFVAGLIDLTWLLERQVSGSDGRPNDGTTALSEMTLPSFITATPETNAHELARQMLGYQIASAVIVDQTNRATALVTATDYLRLYAQGSALHESI
jgi:CBS domain-containing protein